MIDIIFIHHSYYFNSKSFSEKAAKYYYDNRYPSYPECLDPCTTMHVKNILRSKKQEEGGEVTFKFPDKVKVYQDVYVKSVLSVGKM